MRPLLASLLLVASCGGGNTTQPDDGSNPYGLTTSGPGVFTVLPLDSSTLFAATPLGMLAPPGHVLPTDHVYLYFVDAWGGQQQLNDCRARPVRAIGGGVVSFILQTEVGGDTKVEVQMTRTFRYYYDHVLLKPGIRVGARVQAGDTIATTTGRCPSMDLGVIDNDVTPVGRVAPARYGYSLHVASPYHYFAEPWRSFLYARIRLFEGVPNDKDGRTDFGIMGKLSGDWFHSSLANASPSVVNGPEGWPKSLAFAYDWFNGAPRISIGGTISDPLVLAVAPGDPDFRNVGVANGLVVYTISGTNGRVVSGWVLAQLLSETRLRVEFVPGTSPRPTAFSGAAQEYVR